MRTFEELERLWQQEPDPPRGRGRVERLVARLGDGEHELLDRAMLTEAAGLEGDRWSQSQRPDVERQITLMNFTVAELVADGSSRQPGDNVIVDLDLSEEELPIGARLRVGEALLEVTDAPHLGCRKFAARFGADARAWVNHEPHRHRRLRGVNCRVVADGVVRLGDEVAVVQ